MSELALSGIRVLDLTELLPGPFATQMLADMGAEVIKIERPKVGDNARNMLAGVFRMVNRGKKSVTLNLKTEEGRDALKRLVRDADILAEGYRPGVTKRLGIDYDTLKAINPRLIYASISGFGQTGPYRDVPGHDLNYMAVGGATALCGTPDGPPEQAVGVPVADLSGSFYTTISVLAALQLRARTGQGQFLDVSITDAVLTVVSPRLGTAQENPAFTKKDILRRAGYGIYETRDKRYVAVGAIEDHFWHALVKVLAIPALEDARYAKSPERWQYTEQIEPLIREKMLGRTHDEWIKILNDNDVPVTTVTSLSSIFEEPQFTQRGMFIKGHGVQYVNFPVPMQGVDARRHGESPALGANTVEILSRAGLTASDIEALKAKGAA